MSILSRLTLSAVIVSSLAAPVMAQTTKHVVKHHAPVTHHVIKAKPVAATTPATPAPTTTATPAPALVKPATN